LLDELRAIEDSGIYSNHGPVARRFEAKAVETVFGGQGACLAVCNATVGLIIALRQAVIGDPHGRFALMPAFTFAATAHAAIWAGMTPLLCDVDPDDWSASGRAEERLLAKHGKAIGVLMPYATFGNDIDLDRYVWLARRYEVGVVIDAAASLGTVDAKGRGFGTGFPHALVYSMHATKTFATGEGGLIYSADPARIAALQAMSNFGFDGARSASLPGINAKLNEVGALLALAKLGELEQVADHRAALTERYRQELACFDLQLPRARRQAMQFMPLLLPRELAPARDAVIAGLAAHGVGAGAYFSPHLAEQPYFQDTCTFGPLPVSDDISARALSLPITDAMTVEDVSYICAALREVVRDVAVPAASKRLWA
jgi:dTDP-4-amino-4,6-dideoxygalactose transaminase